MSNTVAVFSCHAAVCIIDINFNALAQPLVLFQEQIRRLITKFTKRLWKYPVVIFQVLWSQLRNYLLIQPKITFKAVYRNNIPCIDIHKIFYQQIHDRKIKPDNSLCPLLSHVFSALCLLFHIFEIIKADVLYHSRKLTALYFQRTVHVRKFHTTLVITLYLRVRDTPKNKHDNFLILSHFSYLLSVRILDKVYKPRGLDNIVCYEISQTMYALAFFFKF